MNSLNHQDLSLRRPATRGSLRERRCTHALFAVMLVPLLACGGSKPRAHSYDKAIGKQEACCSGLQDVHARQHCEEGIVKIDEDSSKSSEVNEATFRCVENNFVCDPATGKATAEANQATYDCLSDLSQ